MESSDLIFGVDQKPPLVTQIMLGLQHCLGVASSLAFPLIIFAAAGAPGQGEVKFIAASLLALGLGAVLMGLKTRFIGTGYLCPLLCEPAFLLVSLMAVQLGGLPLLFGMLFLSGLFQIVFAAIYPYLKKLLSIEVSGIIVLMVGLSLVKPDLIYSTGSTNIQNLSFAPADLITAGAALATMLLLAVWNFGAISRYSLLIGMLVGFGVASWQGLLTDANYAKVLHAAWFSPSVSFTLSEMHFNADLIVPFLVATLAMTLKGVGGFINCQKVNTPNWLRPNQNTIRKGIFTNALALIASSLVGGVGLGVANNNIGLSIATKVTSRYVAITTGFLLIIFAFIPKIAMLFVIMPKPVIGAALVFVTSYVIVAGIQILASRLLDTRKIFIIGLSLMAGIIVQIHPANVANFPPVLQPILTAPIVITTLVAIILNLVFHIYATAEASFVLSLTGDIEEELQQNLLREAKKIAASTQVTKEATAVLSACLADLKKMGVNELTVNLTSTDYELKIRLTYHGEALAIGNKKSQFSSALDIIRSNSPEFSLITHSDAHNQIIEFCFVQ